MAIELREDQKDVVKKLVNALSSAPWVALQAPTGWGKTLVGLAVIKELGLKPALWLTPRLSIEIHVYNHAVNYFGLKTLATAGKEKMCAFNRSIIDFAKGVCRGCPLNKPVRLGDLKQLSGSLDFGRVKEYAESMGICPYSLQSMLERYNGYDVVIAHYNRVHRLIRAIKPRMVVVDESHNLVLPTIHKIDARVMEVLLGKLGFEEDEIGQIIKSPETLKMVLNEMIDALVTIAFEDNDLKPIIEEVVQMLGCQVWFFDGSDGTITALELPLTNLSTDAQILYMSATLPPSLLGSFSVITIKRGWVVPIKVDAKYSFTVENVRARRDEMVRYIRSKFLRPSTLIFATASREVLLGGVDEVVWEDDLGSKAPCDFRSGILALRTFGKFIEGVDLGCFENLVVLGYPILPPDAMRRLEARGVDERSLAVMKSIQLIGRVVRTATQPPQLPSITLADKRFLQIKDELQKYEIQAQLET
jgi:DNA polymerase III delta prime subunit